MPLPFSGNVSTVRIPDYVPRPKRPCYDHLRIEPEKEYKLILLSQRLTCVLVHAVEGRTLPCTGDRETCWLSHAEYGTRWQAWAFAIEDFKPSRLRMVTLTPVTVDMEPRLLDQGEDLRGRRLTLRRADRRIRSRLCGSVDWISKAPYKLPLAPDLLDQLGVLWAAPDRPEKWSKGTTCIDELRERYMAKGGGK